MIIQDTSKAMPHLPGTRVASRLEHPATQEIVLLHTLHPLQDMPKVGLRSLGTRATLVGAPVAHADMCGSGRWLPAATCATPAVKPPLVCGGPVEQRGGACWLAFATAPGLSCCKLAVQYMAYF